jgi:hypothetical protein
VCEYDGVLQEAALYVGVGTGTLAMSAVAFRICVLPGVMVTPPMRKG